MTRLTAFLVALLIGGGFYLEATSLASKQNGKAFPWNDGAPTAHSKFELD